MGGQQEQEQEGAGDGGDYNAGLPGSPPQALLERLKDYGQEQALAAWDDLTPEQRDLVVQDLEVSRFIY